MKKILYLTGLVATVCTSSVYAGSIIPSHTTAAPTQQLQPVRQSSAPMVSSPTVVTTPVDVVVNQPLPVAAAMPQVIATEIKQSNYSRELPVIRSVQQWRELAEETSTEVIAALDLRKNPIYISDNPADSPPFLHVFRNFLIDYLVKKGALVAATEKSVATINIDYTSQIVVHRNGSLPPELTEVVVTTRMVQGRRILMSSSKPFRFYINDSGQYVANAEEFMVKNNLTPNRRFSVTQ